MSVLPAVRDKTLIRVLICLILSGAAGLIYQVAWLKALGLIFGHTVYAVAAVLAVFMGGLAAGSAILSRWSAQSRNLVSMYSRLELLIGVTGGLSLAALHVVQTLYLAVYPAMSHWQPLLFGIRFFGAIFVLFIPTFLMGGTFPILVAATVHAREELAVRTGQMYWVNTAGGVFGTLLAGFILLPTIGLTRTIIVAAVLNLTAGLMAWGNSQSFAVKLSAMSPVKPPAASKWLLWLFGAVGFAAMAFEIAWTRMLAVMIGSSTYAFTLMLATFLSGIVIGSMAFQLSVKRLRRRLSLSLLQWVQIGIGVCALGSLILFPYVASAIPGWLQAMHQTFAGLLATQFATAAVTVLPTAICFGFNFPMIIALAESSPDGTPDRTPSVSSAVGTAYAANTMGAIIGSLATGLWLIPRLGSFRVVALVAMINLMLAVAVHLRQKQRRFLPLAAGGILIVSALFLVVSSHFYNQSLMSISAVLYGNSYEGRLTLGEIAATMDLVYATEGINDSIAVVRTEGDVALRVNGKIDASTQDSRTQLLLGHLGAAFHHSPRRVLIIGFGSGMTVSAVARYPDVQQIDCVEIEPAVIRAAPYLESLNRGVLNDPRVRVIFDDARNFLLTSQDRYDLIISEPSNPWIAGIASLFTSEYYAAARQRLAPGGMFVQWLQAYSLPTTDVSMIAATFASHFGSVTLWHGCDTDFLLLGRTDSADFEFEHLKHSWQEPGVAEDFATMQIHRPEGLFAYFVLDNAGVRRLATESRQLNTDDRTLLEYDAPRGLLRSELVGLDHDFVSKFRGTPLPEKLSPSLVGNALEAGLATDMDLNDSAGAQAFLGALARQPESVNHDVARGRIALNEGRAAQAREYFAAALRLDPSSPDAAYWLAKAEKETGDRASARATLDALVQLHPSYLPALEEGMQLAAGEQDFVTALTTQLRRIDLMPHAPAVEYCRLGVILIKTSNFSEAESALSKGLGEDSYSYACHFELGELYLRTGKLTLAKENFEWAVRHFPDNDVAAFRALAGIEVALGDKEAARETLDEGRRVFPQDAGLLK